MYCSECGKWIPEDSRFCEHCGSPVLDLEKKEIRTETAEETSSGERVGQTRSNQPQKKMQASNSGQKKRVQRSAPTRKKSVQGKPAKELTPEEAERQAKRRKKFLGIAGAAAAALIVIGVLSVVITPSINLNKYITVSATGYDTVGKLEVTFDMDSLAEDYGSKLAGSKYNALTSSSSSVQYSAASAFYSACVSWTVDQESGLSNGDTVTLTWDCDSAYAESYYGYKIKCSEITYTVEGLEEAETFDPFEGVEVVFEGIAPDGTAYITVSDDSTAEAADAIRYQLDVDSGLSNGDTVTVSVYVPYSDDAAAYCAEYYGEIPSPMEMTVTVSGLQSYVTELSEISDEYFSSLKSAAAAIYNNEAGDWEETESLTSLDYIGAYLLTTIDTEYYGDFNQLYLVFKAQIQNTYSSDEESYSAENTVYWFVKFYNVTVYEDGALSVDTENYSLPGSWIDFDSGIKKSRYSTYGWSYRGYASLSELYTDAVEGELEEYNCETLINEEAGESMEAATEEAETGEDAEEGIIFPNSSEELLTASEIEALTDEELRYAINEIYARNGYIFKDETLLEYYRQYDWYSEDVAAEDFTTDLLNDIEFQNVELLQEERSSRS